MEKGPFSVEWLAQSSRGAARPAARRPRSPPGGAGSQESTADLGESRLSSRAGRAAGPLVAAVRLNGRRTRGRRRTAAARAAAAYVTARATRRPLREGCVMSVSCVSSSLVCPSPSPPPSPHRDVPILSPQPRSGTGRPRTAAAAPGTKRRRAAGPCPVGPAPSSRPRSCRSWSGASASSATSASARSGAWPPR